MFNKIKQIQKLENKLARLKANLEEEQSFVEKFLKRFRSKKRTGKYSKFYQITERKNKACLNIAKCKVCSKESIQGIMPKHLRTEHSEVL